MRTVVQVVSSQGPSLRDRIVNDERGLRRAGLEVVREKKPGRSPGWAKLKAVDRDERGVINFRWDETTRTLLCHVVTKRAGRPHAIIGDFVDYLLAHCRKRIRAINVFTH